MINYKGNTMSDFRNFERDWRVALAAIIHPTNVKNITTTDYMKYTPKTPYDSRPVISRGDRAGVVVRQEDAEFEAGDYIIIKRFLKNLEKGTETEKKTLTSTLFEDDNVELNFADRYDISIRDRSLLDVMGINGVSGQTGEDSLLEATKNANGCILHAPSCVSSFY